MVNKDGQAREDGDILSASAPCITVFFLELSVLISGLLSRLVLASLENP